MLDRYNYGWSFVNNPIWLHPGDMPGFHTHIIYDRSNSTRIILLSNEDRPGFLSLVRAVSEEVLGVQVGGVGIQIGR